MKKLHLISIILIALVFTACKEDKTLEPEERKFTISETNKQVSGIANDESISFSSEIKNTGKTDINLKFEMEIISLVSGHEVAVQWGMSQGGQLLSPVTEGFTVDESINLPAGETLAEDDFKAFLYPNGKAGESVIKFTVFEEGNPGNSKEIEFNVKVDEDVVGHSLELTAESTELKGDKDKFEIAFYPTITNSGESSVEIMCRMEIIELAPSHKSAFCWGSIEDGGKCYPPSITSYNADFNLNLMPGSSTSHGDFICYIYPNGSAGTSTVKYIIWEPGNPDNRQELTFDITAE